MTDPSIKKDDQPLLDITDLSVQLSDLSGRRSHVLEDVSLSINHGESLGIVGESGSGKSVLARTILGLHPRASQVEIQGNIKKEGVALLEGGKRHHRKTLGTSVSMIFQDPSSSLNPVVRVGTQVIEALTSAKRTIPRADRQALVKDLLKSVGLDEVSRISRAFPGQLSGGQRQRVGIAAALAGKPQLLLADEPTTALDVLVQRTVLDLLEELRLKTGLALVHITHDLALLSGRTDRIVVLYAGRVMENAPTAELLSNPVHPYTRALLSVTPKLHNPHTLPMPQIPGTMPSLDQPRTGCPFASRCPAVEDRCINERPPTVEVSKPQLTHTEPAKKIQHTVACWRVMEDRDTALQPAGLGIGRGF